MRFLTDYAGVKFTGINHIFDVYSTFVEFKMPFSGNEVSIKFYGIIIAFGFLLAVLFGGRMAYKWKIDLNKMLDVLLWGTIFGILGARLYYVAFEWTYYSQHPAEILAIWNGGLAIYGGLIGGMLAAFFVCRKIDLNFYKLLDMCGMSFLIGQGIGRWGNFTNQEAFGTNTSMPWGMYSQKVADYISSNQTMFSQKGITMDPSLPVHPTFLYESIWCIAGFFIIWYICRRHYKFAGQLILTYGVIYGLERAVVEGFRTDSLYIGNTMIRVSQLLSAIIAVLCLAILIIKFVQLKKHPKEYNPVEVLPADKDYELDDKDQKKSEEHVNSKKVAKEQMKKNKLAEKKLREGKTDGKDN